MDEADIFHEWLKEELGVEIIDPLEYVVLRDTLQFRRYLLRRKIIELFKLFMKKE